LFCIHHPAQAVDVDGSPSIAIIVPYPPTRDRKIPYVDTSEGYKNVSGIRFSIPGNSQPDRSRGSSRNKRKQMEVHSTNASKAWLARVKTALYFIILYFTISTLYVGSKELQVRVHDSLKRHGTHDLVHLFPSTTA
jgi:hypothetical protein